MSFVLGVEPLDRYGPPFPRREKVADTGAEMIRRHILRDHLRPGTRLGSLGELTEFLGLSRGSARETIRLLEHQGLISVKSGPAGGVFVAEPAADDVIRASANYLQGVEPHKLYVARLAIEPLLADAAARAGEGISADIHEVISAEQTLLDDVVEYNRCSIEFHRRVALCSGRDPLAMFATVLLELTGEESKRLTYDRDSLSANHQAHVKIAEAVAAGNPSLAATRMRRHIAALAAWSESSSQIPVRGAARRAPTKPPYRSGTPFTAWGPRPR